MSWSVSQPIVGVGGLPTPEFVVYINSLTLFRKVDDPADIPAEPPVGTFYYVITAGAVTAIYAGADQIWP